MSNTLLTITMITRESLRILENNLTFTAKVNREYDDRFAREGAKIGTTLNVRKPVKYRVSSGAALQLQDTTETTVPVVLDQQKHVDFEFSSVDLTLTIDDFSKRYVVPAVSSLANKVDNDGLKLYKKVANMVGAPGTVPNTLLTYLEAGAALDNEAAPVDELRSIVINPTMQVTIVDALKSLFQSSTQIAEQYRKGRMGTAAGFEWSMDQNVATHTFGARGGSPVVASADQTGTSLNISGATASTTNWAKEGDVFTITGVNAVNPQSYESIGALRKFVVTANASSDAGGLVTLSIFPALDATTAYQTVDALPANNAPLTFIGTASSASPQGLAFHRDAFTYVTADLAKPNGTDMSDRVSSKKLGLSLRLVRDYDINTDKFPTRIDILYGWAALRPELACRIAS